MDHAQGRAFHHHLARAIMHLNYLAGLLPFFEPSIEWDDPTMDHQFRHGRPNHMPRNLHTFVPLPASSSTPSMVSHAGIPSHMVVNPEPNLRPLTVFRPHPEEEEHHATEDTSSRNPAPKAGHTSPAPPGTTPIPDTVRVTTRITTPVPVRSKQRTNSTEDPQPKKQRSAPVSETTTPPTSLPIISEIPYSGFNSDDSEDEAASKAPSIPDTSAHDLSRTTTLPSSTTNPTPPDTSTSVTLTPNPTIHIPQPSETSRPPSETFFRPWSGNDDQELINLKNDTKSRPSWKTIGARLRRDPHVCKLRWGILKNTDQHGRVHPLHEPEAED